MGFVEIFVLVLKLEYNNILIKIIKFFIINKIIIIMELEISNCSNETNDVLEECSLNNFFYIKTENIISYISDFINTLIEQNKNKKPDKQTRKNDVFYSKKIPNLTIKEYLVRIRKYSDIEDLTLICVFIYIKKFIERNNYIILINNIYRIILAACTIAIKFHEDSNYKNLYIAKIGGLDLLTMNKIEYYFYVLLNFDLIINEEDFKKIENELLIENKKIIKKY